MDPNATLQQLRELVRHMIDQLDESEIDNGIDPDDTNRLLDLFTGLDVWLTKGGFLPRQWERSVNMTSVIKPPQECSICGDTACEEGATIDRPCKKCVEQKIWVSTSFGYMRADGLPLGIYEFFQVNDAGDQSIWCRECMKEGAEDQKGATLDSIVPAPVVSGQLRVCEGCERKG